MDKTMNRLDLRCGDAVQLMQQLEDNSIDVVIADPPYNLGKNYGNNFDSKGFEDYLGFSLNWLQEAKRVLKPTGTIYVFMGVRFISYIYKLLETDLKLHFNSWIVWHYTQGIGKTRGFSPRHDDILMFTKTEQYNFNLDPVRIPQKYYRERNNMRGANPGDVWEFSHVHYCNENRQDHPTQKPEGLLERLILASSNLGDTILDPFFGSGTTPRVCQQLGRNFIGFEINPEYVTITEQRLQKEFTGFDSIDPRMERIPNDLRDPDLRSNYLKNHLHWFLQNHEGSLDVFRRQLKEKYGDELETENPKNSQTSLF
jgi:DNA modification methylase